MSMRCIFFCFLRVACSVPYSTHIRVSTVGLYNFEYKNISDSSPPKTDVWKALGGMGLLSCSMLSVYFFAPEMKNKGYSSDSFTNLGLAVVQTTIPGIFGFLETTNLGINMIGNIVNCNCWSSYLVYSVTSYVSNVALLSGSWHLGSTLFSLATSFVMLINVLLGVISSWFFSQKYITWSNWMGMLFTTAFCCALPFTGNNDESQDESVDKNQIKGYIIALIWCIDIGLQPYVYSAAFQGNENAHNFFQATQFPWAAITGVFYVIIQMCHIFTIDKWYETYDDFTSDVGKFLGFHGEMSGYMMTAFMGTIGQAFWAPGMNLLVKGAGEVFSALCSVVANVIPWVAGMVFNGDSFNVKIFICYIGIVIGNVIYLACDLSPYSRFCSRTLLTACDWCKSEKRYICHGEEQRFEKLKTCDPSWCPDELCR
jgi:hypothetical protein